MKRSWTLVMAFTLIAGWAVNVKAYPNIKPNTSKYSYSEVFIKWRCQELNIPFYASFQQDKISFAVKKYLTSGRLETKKMLGRAKVYLPIFEAYNKEFRLPAILKYIPVVESRLYTDAVSPAGASGLWQFMPGTARHYELQINELVDERLDPYRATKAAMRLLCSLKEEFGDWALTLAAYNCGPGRVRWAIKKTGCKNFWDIRHLLPRQTQRYIPSLVAAIYLFENYQVHRLEPRTPRILDMQPITLQVKKRISFHKLAQMGGTSRELIQQLNPSYLEEVVPWSPRGRYITLPKKAARKIHDYLNGASGSGQESVVAFHGKDFNGFGISSEKRPKESGKAIAEVAMPLK